MRAEDAANSGGIAGRWRGGPLVRHRIMPVSTPGFGAPPPAYWKYPLVSMITCVAFVTYTLTAPLVPAGTMAAFATT